MTRRTRKGSRILLLAVLSLTPLGCLLAPRVAFAQSSVEKLQEFGLDQVQVTDQYQQNLFTKDVTYLITTLDSNRLLAGFKAFGTPDSSFWCCTGTGMENYTKLGDSLYFHDATDLYVIGYVSSTLNWSDRGLSLTQTTDLPLSNNVTFTIGAAPTDAVNVKFRKPYWLASCQPMTVTVNGQSVNAVDAGGYLSVSRVWQAGDKVVLTMPMEVQVSRLPDNQNAVAFTYGPIVLSAGLGTASMTTAGHAATIMATMPSGLQDTITINSGTAINTWIANIKTNLVQTAGQLQFNLKNTDSDSKLTFIPHYSRYQDRYGIYWKLAGTAGGTASTEHWTIGLLLGLGLLVRRRNRRG